MVSERSSLGSGAVEGIGIRTSLHRLRKKSIGQRKTTTGAKAHLIPFDIRGPEGPLFHGNADAQRR